MKRNLKIILICFPAVVFFGLFCFSFFVWYPKIENPIIENAFVKENKRLTSIVSPTLNPSKRFKNFLINQLAIGCKSAPYVWLDNNRLLFRKCKENYFVYNVISQKITRFTSSLPFVAISDFYIMKGKFCAGKLSLESANSRPDIDYISRSWLTGEDRPMRISFERWGLFFNKKEIGNKNLSFSNMMISPDQKYAAITVSTDTYGLGDVFVLECK